MLSTSIHHSIPIMSPGSHLPLMSHLLCKNTKKNIIDIKSVQLDSDDIFSKKFLLAKDYRVLCVLDEMESIEITNKGPKLGRRHVQISLLCACYFLEYASRENFALAIVAMTDANSTSSHPDVPIYNWKDTHVLLSAFYWGFVVTQIPGGQLSKMFGPKYIMLVATLVNSIATVSIPLMAQWLGSHGVMTCRIIQGIFQGVFFPCGHTLLGKWVPVEERSWLTMIVYMGVAGGIIFANPITGLLAASEVGWPSSFYLFGSLGFGWCLVWFFFGCNDPAGDPKITKEERRYIETSLGSSEELDIATPWKAILTSKHVWGLVLGSIGIEYGNAFISTEIPTYLSKVMDFSTASSGFMFALPLVVGTTCGFFYGALSDYIIAKNYLSMVNARRVFCMYAAIIQAALMIAIAYLNKDNANLSVFLLCLANVGTGAELYGCSVNIMDISPRFAGVVIGITQTVSMGCSLFAPILVQFMVPDEEDALEWRNIFFIGAAIYVIPSAIYCFLASSKKQWWDDGPTKVFLAT